MRTPASGAQEARDRAGRHSGVPSAVLAGDDPFDDRIRGPAEDRPMISSIEAPSKPRRAKQISAARILATR